MLLKIFDQLQRGRNNPSGGGGGNNAIGGTNAIDKLSNQLNNLAGAFERVGAGNRGGSNLNDKLSRTSSALTNVGAAHRLKQISSFSMDGRDFGPTGTAPIPGQPPAYIDPKEVAAAAGALGQAGEALGGAGEGASGIAGALGGAAGVLGEIAEVAGPIGIIIVAVLAVGGVIYKITDFLIHLPNILLNFGNSVLKSQEHLKEFSGEMAAVFNNKEVFETLQNMRIGEATAGSAGNLEEAYEALSEALEPITILVSNIWNQGLANVIDGMAMVINLLTTLTPILEILEFINAILTKVYEAAQWFKELFGSEKKEKISPFEQWNRDFSRDGAGWRSSGLTPRVNRF